MDALDGYRNTPLSGLDKKVLSEYKTKLKEIDTSRETSCRTVLDKWSDLEANRKDQGQAKRSFLQAPDRDWDICGGGLLTIDPRAKVIRAFGKSKSLGNFPSKSVEAILSEYAQCSLPGYTISADSTDKIWG